MERIVYSQTRLVPVIILIKYRADKHAAAAAMVPCSRDTRSVVSLIVFECCDIMSTKTEPQVIYTVFQ